MLIPSIDLMDGKIVQLVQGERLALEFSDFEAWIERFQKFPLVQLIDLDAAKRRGSNAELIGRFLQRLPCQVGGGIHTLDAARRLLDRGAVRVIFGSALLRDGQINQPFAAELAHALGSHRLTFAIDSKQGYIVVRGWQERTAITAAEAIRALESHCDAFLYTHVDSEGLQQGFPVDVAQNLRAVTSRKLIVAGGVTSKEEIQTLDGMGIDAVVGMAIYTGRLSLDA